jgi:hypothetical protein
VDKSVVQTSLAPLPQGMSPTSTLLIPTAARERLPQGVRQALEYAIMVLRRTILTERDLVLLRDTISGLERQYLPFVAGARPPQGWASQDEELIGNVAYLRAWWYAVQWPRA